MNKNNTCDLNNEIIESYAANDLIEVERFSEHHVRFTTTAGARLDYWPATRKAYWVGTNKPSFFIKDLQDFIVTQLMGDKANPAPASDLLNQIKWEYMVSERLNFKFNQQDTLNELGKEGWELVAVVESGKDNSVAYLKRRVTQ